MRKNHRSEEPIWETQWMRRRAYTCPNLTMSVISWNCRRVAALATCDNHIKAQIDDRKEKIWMCNFIYRNPCFGRRKKQWRAITTNNCNEGESQLFIGDFNDILSQEEKIGLHPKPQSQVREFKQFVGMNYLMDLDLKGERFTWFSNPRNRFITRDKIDRALANWKWRALYQHVLLTALPAISSDHCPIVLNINQVQRMEKNFKFEAFWTDHDECENVVKKGWDKENIHGRDWEGITRKMENCKEELKKWTKKTFKSADKEIYKLKEELKKLQDSNLTQEKQEKIQLIKEDIAILWKLEEKYWGQRGRLKWLKWRDKKTSFFHATTIQRRKRNKIDKLKNEAGS
ncbi:hypothetical protein Ahy_A08g038468 [Arachis hypogaea]|uniref:Endonuclease/exonuclease/phosphatase domain-containing protein n=1 Tax=Arachis hypogaea TaxID=3818 RepID=A0A445BTH9_ARAHY|nr:hypothetical protein Ahy_A08g038468 [Arachis hypogaea]